QMAPHEVRRARGPRYSASSLRVREAARPLADAALLPARGEEPRARAARRAGAARRQPLEPARSAAGRRGRAAAAPVPGKGGAVPDPVVRGADPAAQRATGPARRFDGGRRAEGHRRTQYETASRAMMAAIARLKDSAALDGTRAVVRAAGRRGAGVRAAARPGAGAPACEASGTQQSPPPEASL